MNNKNLALNWIAELNRIEKFHATDEGALSDASWITKNEAINMLIQAETFLKKELNIKQI